MRDWFDVSPGKTGWPPADASGSDDYAYLPAGSIRLCSLDGVIIGKAAIAFPGAAVAGQGVRR